MIYRTKPTDPLNPNEFKKTPLLGTPCVSKQTNPNWLKDVRDRKILHRFFKVLYIIIKAILSRKSTKKFTVTNEKIFCVYKAFDHKK